MRRLILVLSASTAAAVMATSAAAAEQPAAAGASALAMPSTARGGAAIGKWGFDDTGMDRTIDPGDSMYGYANGIWAKKTAIPADKSNYGMFTMLADLSDERTRAIID